MNYYISDLHIGHKRIVHYETVDYVRKNQSYPFTETIERDAAIIRNWNKTIKPGDTVYITGDVSMHGDYKQIEYILSSLNGQKFLILGNHDSRKCSRLVDSVTAGVIGVSPMHTVKDNGRYVVLCHYPILFWRNQAKGSYLVYGHVHDSVEADIVEELGPESIKGRYPEFRALNACACRNDFTPQLLDDLIAKHGLNPDCKFLDEVQRHTPRVCV